MATKFYTADSPVTGKPWAAFSATDGAATQVFDPKTRTWLVSGWPLKYLTGADLNFSDVDPADLPPILDALAATGRSAPGMVDAG